ncbi:MAG: exopolysaccharide biosynthesis polyprenyl glycosylphosphotransferase [Lachnospiraceae bacterium]|nr:exopolysaccharide biosynthesis polyprenyl glycosylphosphotransferase [Lachnospiraceae bacterium]
MEGNRLQAKRLIMFWSKILILVIQIALYAYVWNHYYKDLMPFQYYKRGNWAIIGMYAVFIFAFNRAFGALKVGYLKTWDVMYSQIFTIFCTNFVTYVQLVLVNGKWAIFKHYVPYFQHFRPMAQLCVMDFAAVLIWALLMRYVYAIIYPPHEMLLIYGDRSPKEIADKIVKRADKYQIKEMINLSEGKEKIVEKMKQYDSVLVGDIPSHERNLFVKICFENNIRCYSIPKLSDIMIRSAESIDLFDSPLMLYRNRGLNYVQSIGKRIMDIIVSLTALILLAIPMLIIAILIKTYDGGPVFYTQKRLTMGGREFDILKFRSMIVDSEKAGARLAKANDDRVTPVGKVIRRMHFDELPQLINILKGDMSVVGPRPERKDIAEEYKKEIPEFDFRLKVKGGLTGYAQVYGQYNTTPYDKLKMDLTYIENYSLWLDIKLMVLTVKILFWKEKSEGVSDSQTTALKK